MTFKVGDRVIAKNAGLGVVEKIVDDTFFIVKIYDGRSLAFCVDNLTPLNSNVSHTNEPPLPPDRAADLSTIRNEVRRQRDRLLEPGIDPFRVASRALDRIFDLTLPPEYRSREGDSA